MARKRDRTTQKATQYSPEDLAVAVQEVRAKRMTTYRASQVYNIPYNTLDARIKGRRGLKSTTMGRPTAISFEVEKTIAEGLREMERNGLGLSRKDVMNLVGEYVQQNKIKTPFRDGIPQSDWLSAFMKRHSLSIKKPQSVEIARKRSCDPFIINPYFDSLAATINTLGLQNKPHLIYNLDETGFSRDPSKTKIVGEVGYPATRTVSSPGRDNISVLLTVNAAGGKLPPLILFKGVNVWDDWLPPQDQIFPGTSFAATKNGWIDSTSFDSFFTKTFLTALGQERPVLLVCDGHKSHISLKVIEVARRENITILVLPPHSSHILQPLDLSVMKSLKSAWDVKMVEWQKRHFGQKLRKSSFVSLFSTIWTELKPGVIMSGFRQGGIYPFSRDVIPESTYDPATLRRWKMSRQDSQQNSINSSLHETEPIASTSSAVFVQESRGDPMTGEPSIFQDTPPGSSQRPHTADTTISTSSKVQNVPLTHRQASSFTLLSSAEYPPLNTVTTPGLESISDTELSQPPVPQNSGKTFQELLLETVKSQSAEEKKERKKRVTKGAAGVITCDEFFSELEKQRFEKDEQQRKKELRKAEREKKKKIPKPVKKKTKRKIRNDPETSSSEDDSDYSIRDSDKEDWEEYMGRMQKEAEDSISEADQTPEETGCIEEESVEEIFEINVYDWVLVKFLGKKSVKFFVGQVLRFESGDPIIKYTGRLSPEEYKFSFPSVDDISSIDKTDVICILPPPEIGRRGVIEFKKFDFSSFNVE